MLAKRETPAIARQALQDHHVPAVHCRVDLADIVHIVAWIPGQRQDYWTPMCQPDQDWLVLKGSMAEGPPTCLWCITGERFR